MDERHGRLVADGLNFQYIEILGILVEAKGKRALSYTNTHYVHLICMPEVVEIPVELAHFQLPKAVHARLQLLLDRQDAGEVLTLLEIQEAEGLVELAEFLSLLHLQSQRVAK
jgi:hypothetical protein